MRKLWLIILLSIIIQQLSFSKDFSFLSSNKSLEITSIEKINENYYALLNESYQEFDQSKSFILKLDSNLEVIDTIFFNIPHTYNFKKIIKYNNSLILYGMIDTTGAFFDHSDIIILNIDTNGALINSSKLMVNNNNVRPGDIIYKSNIFYLTYFEQTITNKIVSRILSIDSNFNIIYQYIDSVFRNNYLDRIIISKDSMLISNGQYLDVKGYGGHTIFLNLELVHVKSLYDTTYIDQFGKVTKSWLNYSLLIENNNIYSADVSFTNNPLDSLDSKLYERISIKKIRQDNYSYQYKVLYNQESIADRPVTIEYFNNHLLVFGTFNFFADFTGNINNGDFYVNVIDTNLNHVRDIRIGDLKYQQLRGHIFNNYEFILYGFEQIEKFGKKTPYIFKINNPFNYVSINNFKSENIIIYPNPTKDKLHININERANEVYLLNSLGQRIEVDMINNEIDLSDFSDGVYYLFINTNSGLYKGKVVKN